MPLGTASCKTYGGKALDGLGGVKVYRNQSNSECRKSTHGSETVCAKVHSRKGNSPNRQIRSQIHAKCKMKSECTDSQEVGLEAAIP